MGDGNYPPWLCWDIYVNFAFSIMFEQIKRRAKELDGVLGHLFQKI